MATWDRDLWKLWPLVVMAFVVLIAGYAGYWPSIPLSINRFGKSALRPEGAATPQLVEWLAQQESNGRRTVSADHYSVIDISSAAVPDLNAAALTRPQLTRAGSLFYCQWQMQNLVDSASPVAIYGAWSTDGQRWSEPQLVFSHQSEPDSKQILSSAPFLSIQDEVYSVAAVQEIVGYSTSDATTFSEPKSTEMSAEFPRGVREIVGFFVRRVLSDGSLGPRITLLRQSDEGFSVADAMRGIEIVDQPLIPDIVRQLATPESRYGGKMEFPVPEIETEDRYRLGFPTSVAIPNNRLLRLWVSEQGLDRLYGQVSPDNGTTWEKPILTNIRNEGRFAVLGTLPSGAIFLIGNQLRGAGQIADPLTIALAFENLQFTECFELRRGAPTRRRSQEPADRRDAFAQMGFQVGACLVHGAEVWIIYSVNAESIEVCRVRLRDLAPALAQSELTNEPEERR